MRVCILNSVLGGQTLAGMSTEYLSRKFFLGMIISGPAITAAGLVLWVHRAHVVRACHSVPCPRCLCRHTRGEWQALDPTSRRTRDRTGDLVVCRSNRGLHDNICPPCVPILRCTIPRMDPGQVFFLYESHRTSDYPRIHLLVGEISPIRFSDFCAPSRVFVRCCRCPVRSHG